MASKEQINAAIELIMRKAPIDQVTAALIEDQTFRVRAIGQAKGPGEPRAASGLKRARKLC